MLSHLRVSEILRDLDCPAKRRAPEPTRLGIRENLVWTKDPFDFHLFFNAQPRDQGYWSPNLRRDCSPRRLVVDFN